MQIFMSYRRSDSADVSGRIYDRLAQHFGADAIFKDVDDIPIGVNFKTYLNDMVKQCDVQLVIIGPNWLDVTDQHGRRLHDPADFVRIEVEAALSRNIPVVPLLVRGATMPPDLHLPDDIKELSYRNGMPIRPDPDFHRDMSRLIEGLKQYLEAKAPPAEEVSHTPPPSPAVGKTPSPVAQPTPMPAPPPPPARGNQAAARLSQAPAHKVESAPPARGKRLVIMGVLTLLVAVMAALGRFVPVASLLSIFVALILGPVPGMLVAGIGASIGNLLSGSIFWAILALVAYGALGFITGRLGWKKGWGGMLIGAAVGTLVQGVIFILGGALVGYGIYYYGFPEMIFGIIISLLGVPLARWLGPRIPALRDW